MPAKKPRRFDEYDARRIGPGESAPARIDNKEIMREVASWKKPRRRVADRIVMRWGVEWRQKDEPPHIQWFNCKPLLFQTRREARAFIEKEWGYIKVRHDLRTAPHFWRLPAAVRVEVIIRRRATR